MKASRPPPAGPIIINQYMRGGQSQIKRVQSAGGRGAVVSARRGTRPHAMALLSAPRTATSPLLGLLSRGEAARSLTFLII